MLRTIFTFFIGLMMTATFAMAQTTTDPAAPAAPAAPATPDAPATPVVADGGIGDWWWLILLVILIALAVWYMMRRRTPTGRV